jgi:hypothetical protein
MTHVQKYLEVLNQTHEIALATSANIKEAVIVTGFEEPVILQF